MRIKMTKRSFLGLDVEVNNYYRLPFAGSAVDTTAVHVQNGYYKPGYRFSQAVCRTDEGGYFLAREISRYDWGTGAEDVPDFTLPGNGHWLRVKRLTLRGALLFALEHSGAEFRTDVLTFLEAAAPASAVRHFADGSMAVTLHLKPRTAALLMEACEEDEWTPLTFLHDATRASVAGRLARTSIAQSYIDTVFNDEAPDEEPGKLPGFSDLDEHCQHILSEYVETRGVDARDALNGAVEMALSDGGLCNDEATAAAKVRRLERQADRGCTLRLVGIDGSEPWEVRLNVEETAALEERSRETGLSFADAVKEMIRNAVAGQRGVGLCAAHRPDLALCAAATPNGDDDESELDLPPSLPTSDDGESQDTQ